MPAMNAVTQTNFQTLAYPQRELAGSKSLASMLPMLITTGVITLVISAVTRLLWLGFSYDFFGAWMEAWLTTWPIAFPLAYLGVPFVKRLTNFLLTPTLTTTAPTKTSGLAISQIEKVASNATVKNHLHLRRTAYTQDYY